LDFVANQRKLRMIAQRALVLTSAVGLGISVLIFAPGAVVEYDLGSATVSANDHLSAINSVRNTILQVFGGLIVFFGAYVTWRRLALGEAQLLAAQDTQVTGRYAKAVEQLGDLSVDVRLGAIYALERIARNSAVDMGPIIEILGAFVRGRSPWPPRIPGQYTEQAPIEDVPTLAVRAADVQAAVTVLGRMMRADQPGLRLHTVDLRKTRMYALNMQGARLGNSSLRSARLYDANLIGADLGRTDLRDCRLMRADLSKANLRGADLEGAQLDCAKFMGAVADSRTCWPNGFDASAAGVVFEEED
jgi:hypothetical protein